MFDIEKKLEEFFQKYTITQINCDTIKKEFPDIHIQSESKYTLLHFVADNNYDTNKAIAMVNSLLELKINPNITDTYGGYSFIHLALYSNYPFAFFKGILPTAIKYQFNVNLKDKDGDSIIHSAIYSEDYFDEISPLFDLLGSNFDIHTINNQKENIIDALNNALKQAKEEDNIKWQKQLEKEKEKISNLLEKQNAESGSSTEKLDGKEKEEQKKYQEFLNDFKVRLSNISSITEISELLELSNNIKEEELRKEIVTELEEKRKAEEQKKYQEFLNDFKTRLSNISSIAEISELLKLSDKIKEEVVKEDVVKKLNERKEKYESLINNAQESFHRLLQLKELRGISNKTVRNTIQQIQDKHHQNKITLENISDVIKEMDTTINSQIDNIVSSTANTIQKSLEDLEKFEKITNRNLTDEVKQLVKKKERNY